MVTTIVSLLYHYYCVYYWWSPFLTFSCRVDHNFDGFQSSNKTAHILQVAFSRRFSHFNWQCILFTIISFSCYPNYWRHWQLRLCEGMRTNLRETYKRKQTMRSTWVCSGGQIRPLLEGHCIWSAFDDCTDHFLICKLSRTWATETFNGTSLITQFSIRKWYFPQWPPLLQPLPQTIVFSYYILPL